MPPKTAASLNLNLILRAQTLVLLAHLLIPTPAHYFHRDFQSLNHHLSFIQFPFSCSFLSNLGPKHFNLTVPLVPTYLSPIYTYATNSYPCVNLNNVTSQLPCLNQRVLMENTKNSFSHPHSNQPHQIWSTFTPNSFVIYLYSLAIANSLV